MGGCGGGAGIKCVCIGSITNPMHHGYFLRVGGAGGGGREEGGGGARECYWGNQMQIAFLSQKSMHNRLVRN